MDKLSERIHRISESQTLKMAKLSRELKSQGIDIINLSLGEPDFPTPLHIKQAAQKAIDDNFTYYPPVAGFMDLREGIVQKFKRENELDYTPQNIIVSTGAKQSIANAVLSLVNPDDEVILAVPYWVSYLEIINLAEGKTVPVRATIDNNFKITPEQLESAITPKTKLFLFSSPCNPTGTVYTKDELKALAQVLCRYENLFVLSDEIYEHINFDGKHESIAQFDFIKEKVIVVNGVSKSFAMTGWRIGYLAAPKWIADACEKIQGQITSGASSIAQKAALAALCSDISPTLKMKDAFLRRRNLVMKLLKEIPGLKLNNPQGAFYVFPDASYYFGKTDGETIINNGEDLCMYLLNKAHVSLVSGDAFGSPDCIRFSYATSDEKLEEAIRRMKEALEKLQPVL